MCRQDDRNLPLNREQHQLTFGSVISDILSPTHLLFVLVVALLVLGPKRLPEVGRALGRGLRDFRNALNTDDLREHMISSEDLLSTTTPSQPDSSAAPPPAEAPPVPTAESGAPQTETTVLANSSASTAPADSPGAASASDRAA